MNCQSLHLLEKERCALQSGERARPKIVSAVESANYICINQRGYHTINKQMEEQNFEDFRRFWAKSPLFKIFGNIKKKYVRDYEYLLDLCLITPLRNLLKEYPKFYYKEACIPLCHHDFVCFYHFSLCFSHIYRELVFTREIPQIVVI